MVWMYGIRLVVSALTPALVITKRQDIELKVQIGFVVSAIVIYIISKLQSLQINHFLILITIVYAIIYILMYVFIYLESKKKENVK